MKLGCSLLALVGIVSATSALAQSSNVCSIRFMSDVTSPMLSELLYLVESCGRAPILIDVQSVGGEVESMIYTYHELLERGVDTHVGYSVASSAVLLMLAGNERTMSRHGNILIHDITLYTEGNADVSYAREVAEGLDIVQGDYIRLISERTGQSVEVIAELVRNHTYLNAKKALALGFVTEIVD